MRRRHKAQADRPAGMNEAWINGTMVELPADQQPMERLAWFDVDRERRDLEMPELLKLELTGRRLGIPTYQLRCCVDILRRLRPAEDIEEVARRFREALEGIELPAFGASLRRVGVLPPSPINHANYAAVDWGTARDWTAKRHRLPVFFRCAQCRQNFNADRSQVRFFFFPNDSHIERTVYFCSDGCQEDYRAGKPASR